MQTLSVSHPSFVQTTFVTTNLDWNFAQHLGNNNCHNNIRLNKYHYNSPNNGITHARIHARTQASETPFFVTEMSWIDIFVIELSENIKKRPFSVIELS
jgi:hypothetical protein